MATGCVGGVVLWSAVRHYEADLPSIAELRVYKAPQVTRILARDGTVLAELYTERRTTVPLATLPAHVKLAVLAAEDAGFYEHEGLNYWGIARAALVNLRAGGTRQGGSTITQQVIKNMTLNARERTLTRKIREALLARRLETELSKDEILEIYLNAIYFGRGRYGIEEAARDDFGKSAKDLSIAQAAMIAGRIANPREFHPRTSMTAALSRRAYVLDQMHAKGFLDDAQWTTAKSEPAVLAPIAAACGGGAAAGKFLRDGRAAAGDAAGPRRAGRPSGDGCLHGWQGAGRGRYGQADGPTGGSGGQRPRGRRDGRHAGARPVPWPL